jgi:glutathione S-transferase
LIKLTFFEIFNDIYRYDRGLDIPNLPYLIDGDFNLSETIPIMFYICQKYKSELLGETIQEQATVNMLSNIIHKAKWDFICECYVEDGLENSIQICKDQLGPISKFLGIFKFINFINKFYFFI